jgi:hypothetical protein
LDIIYREIAANEIAEKTLGVVDSERRGECKA